VSGSAISALDVAMFTVPTDAPEADGTLSWNATTPVLVEVRCDGMTGIGCTPGAGR
jgi:hypothetical protein